jgi:hypothetical protein
MTIFAGDLLPLITIVPIDIRIFDGQFPLLMVNSHFPLFPLYSCYILIQ